jgi:uncharacterized protein (DUF2062 family)
VKLNLRRASRYWHLRLIRLQGSPHSLALGAAAGAFIAATPTMPLHTALILAVTLPLGANALSALAASAVVSNPLTIPAQYYLAWKIGSLLLPGRLHKEQLDNLLNMVHHTSLLALLKGDHLMQAAKTIEELGLEAMLVLLVGGLLLAVPIGIVTYLLAIHFFTGLQKKRRQRHLLNHAKS